MGEAEQQISGAEEICADEPQEAAKRAWKAPQLHCVDLSAVTRAQAAVVFDGVTVS